MKRVVYNKVHLQTDLISCNPPSTIPLTHGFVFISNQKGVDQKKKKNSPLFLDQIQSKPLQQIPPSNVANLQNPISIPSYYLYPFPLIHRVPGFWCPHSIWDAGEVQLPQGNAPRAIHWIKMEALSCSREETELGVDGGYLLKYQTTITGKVQSGKLLDLRGLNVRVVFMWFAINGVVKSGRGLNFYVSPLSPSFPLSNFEECPKCRCGFACTTSTIIDL